MKAYVLRSYGPPDALNLVEVDQPVPGDDEVLVRVCATSVNPYDWHHLRGEPRIARLMPGTLGLRGPKFDILGCDMAGRVESVGAGVTQFRPGDDVFALLRGGGFAQYVSVRQDLLVPMPERLSYEQAAALPMAALTALLSLRVEGRIQSGQTVLVNGAAGGIGTFAVQLARASGAQVTGVCSTRNVDLVRSLGADDVIDYTRADFTRTGKRYDLLLDIAGSRTVRACRRVLEPRGTFVAVGGPAGRWLQPAGQMFAAAATGPFVSQRVVVANSVGTSDRRQSLRALVEFIEAGQVTPVIDRSYPFEDLRAAITYQEQGHCAGKVVVTV